MDWRDEVWFFDTEVLPHDWLFCATNKEKRVAIHNDTAMLREFLETERPFLCGYNCNHYDNYIISCGNNRKEGPSLKAPLASLDRSAGHWYAGR